MHSFNSIKRIQLKTSEAKSSKFIYKFENVWFTLQSISFTINEYINKTHSTLWSIQNNFLRDYLLSLTHGFRYANNKTMKYVVDSEDI